MTIRAKFVVTEKINRANLWGDKKPTCNVVLSAVNGEKEENKTWARYTPSGRVEMQIDNPEAYDAFELGAEYLLTFQKAG